MKKRTLFGLLAAIISSVAIAGSTINPNVPAANSVLSSAPIRANAQAAYNDINNILSMYAAPTAPSSPTAGQFWRDTSAAPQPVKQYDGTSWVTWGTLNVTTHVWTPIAATGSLVATAPITVGFGSGIATFGIGLDANFATISSQLGFANIAAGNVLGNSTTNPAEPTTNTLTAILDRNWGSTNLFVPYRTGGVWVGGSLTTMLDAVASTTQGSLLVRGASTWAPQTQISTDSIDLGVPTGGNKGSGTINLDGGYYVNGNQTVFGGTVCGRLTLTTLTPVMIATTTGQTTIYFTPTNCAVFPIYDGSAWESVNIAELSNITSNSSTGNAGPAAVTANKNYDLFVWSNAGTPTLTRGGAWNTATVRSSTTENDLERVNGVWMNKNAITNGPAVDRGVYVGTVRSNGSSQIDWTLGAQGTAPILGVWNMFNRVNVVTTVSDGNATWSYTSATIRQANGGASVNTITVISGQTEEYYQTAYQDTVSIGAINNGQTNIGVCNIDVSNAFNKSARASNNSATNALLQQMSVTAAFPPQLGFHTFNACEQGDGTNAETYQGQTLNGFTIQTRM